MAPAFSREERVPLRRIKVTTREKEVIEAIKKLGGIAHPTSVGTQMGISGGYAEQLCRDLVWSGSLVKRGLKFKLADS